MSFKNRVRHSEPAYACRQAWFRIFPHYINFLSEGRSWIGVQDDAIRL